MRRIFPILCFHEYILTDIQQANLLNSALVFHILSQPFSFQKHITEPTFPKQRTHREGIVAPLSLLENMPNFVTPLNKQANLYDGWVGLMLNIGFLIYLRIVC